VILMGNEAIVRGALEAGVQFVSTYPGTPSSEIGNIFFRISEKLRIYFEFSINEKLALEAAVGASFSGLKCLVAMKNFGLNVCSDALAPFLYTGSKGATVIITADDPSCHSSAQSEENSRPFSYLAHLPTLEPATPQECKDFVKLAFQISEKFQTPVLIRNTTRVSHQRGVVKLSKMELTRPNLVEGKFIKDTRRFVTLPPRVLEMKKELLEKIEKIRTFIETSPINQLVQRRASDSLNLGIITSGVSYLYVREALKELNLDLPVLKLGFFYPLPEKKIKNFIKKLKKVLIVEELEPFLEKEVQGLAKEANCKIEITGKNLLPEVGELRPEIVMAAIAKFAGKKFKLPTTNYQPKTNRRSPQFCPGCPYWLVVAAIKKALRLGSGQTLRPDSGQATEVIFGGDIGCYMLLGMPQFGLQDYLSCMGSSLGIAHGIKKVSKQKLITFIGDSTFFHAGLPALANIIFNKSNPLVIILENQTTAMTGHQPHPSAKSVLKPIKIEDICRALGVNNLAVLDPANQDEFGQKIREFLQKDEVAVIIVRKPCIFVKDK